ncbi:TPM domain-containing protein [Acinetobacter sp. MD2(2019)]|uniref:TPM domain-containing protein n=1 Tax=Acinetobacter sp. MD2(2019) TaxID=2605273 RepID=UPI002D1F5759|nr:TPM domain-containing protein [Acinetobacter sp. MD2(2019)]MEB3754343.1 TPM domain-containing protein [Acinetobacter sp. MD2(2019)]
MIKKSIYQQIILFILCLVVHVTSYAISPELLAQLKFENIVDTTNTLTAAQIKNLKAENSLIYKKRNIDLKILLISSLNKEPIEFTTIKIFDALKIGNKDLDNGVLLLIAKDDHKMRIEVGYGLEGNLTDLEANHIIRDDLAPNFKNNDYYTGILKAQHRIGLADDFSKSRILEKKKDQNEIILDEPSKHFINYFVVFIWNLSISILLVVYFSPIYQKLKQPENKIYPFVLPAIVFFPIHHLFSMIVTGLNFFVLLTLYPFLIYCIAKVNKHINLFYLLKIEHFPKKLPKKFMIFLTIFTLPVGFIAHQLIPILFFIAFAPNIFFTIYKLVDTIAQYYKAYYPPEYQAWLSIKVEHFVSYTTDNHRTYYAEDTDRNHTSSETYSNYTSSSIEERDSGGSSGGGGASGSW